jgi:hypothetical protein
MVGAPILQKRVGNIKYEKIFPYSGKTAKVYKKCFFCGNIRGNQTLLD